jgi:beta-galactosidase
MAKKPVLLIESHITRSKQRRESAKSRSCSNFRSSPFLNAFALRLSADAYRYSVVLNGTEVNPLFNRALTLVYAAILLFVCLLTHADAQILVDASAPYLPPESSPFQPGAARAPNGQTLGLNQRFLTRDGKPWLPVMGEFHFSRVPASEWEEELLKMKSAGVNVVATYVIWLHHEEVEGQFDWSGDRDLRRFTELCAKHHLKVYVRIGPWAHGEVRNGGFPDWLLAKGPTRVNDPVYLSYVTKFYDAIGQQLHGLLWKDGGPVVGVQLENEYSNRAAGGGEAHILELKRIAAAAGLDVPYYSVTGWDGAAIPEGAVLPVFGGYPDAPWDASLKNLPPSEVYNFRFHSRVTGNMGAMGATPAAISALPPDDTPFMTAEVGGGIEDTYHRRPIISSDDVAAIFSTMLGSGVNLYGVYMFQGGQNPQGKLSTLQESQATGYPNDLPIKSYDFQAPLSTYGEERASFRKFKLVNYFLNAFGDQLAPMTPHAPTVLPKDAADISVPRLAVRTHDSRGFLFVNNYLRGAPMPARHGFQVKIKLPDGNLLLPDRPVDVPSGAYFIWPFNMDLGGLHLRYSSAQLFTRLDTSDTFVFFCVPGIRCELSFGDEVGLVVHSTGGHVVHSKGNLNIIDLNAGTETTLSLQRPSGKTIHILVLSEEDAENAWRVRLNDMEHLLITPQQFFTSDDQITLNSDDPSFRFTLFPAVATSPKASSQLMVKQNANGSTDLSARLTDVKPHLTLTQIRKAGDVPAVKVGQPPSWRSQGVAEAPAEATFAAAAQWRVELSPDSLHGLSNLFLNVDYTGDVARLSAGDHLLDDNFFNGNPWKIGMKRFLDRREAGDLRLEILPLRSDSPIFLEDSVRKTLPVMGQIDQLHSVRIIPEYQLSLRTAQ